ncbi:MAG TPA: DUF1080 domain-containing protein [Candidatus Acidoferrum sp.]|jgi:hypothetical protein|nr:DUF1080 domain-containing protein [Candidatus Acidoferrum sp.]
MSNANPFLRLAPLLCGVLFLHACSSEPPKPAASLPAAERKAEAPATTSATSTSDSLAAAAAKPSALFAGEGWEQMFDGHTLTGWKETLFAGRGEVECRSGLLVLNMGDPFTGLNWTNDFPKMNYEIALDAMRVMGSDFFCGMTVPVRDSFCSLIVGGWGGSLVGISSLDGMDASENETMKYVSFESGRWYRLRLRITEGRIEGWLDDKKLIDVNTAGKKISLRPGEIEMSKPFGLASWQTSAAFRQIKMHHVDTPADPPRKEL